MIPISRGRCWFTPGDEPLIPISRRGVLVCTRRETFDTFFEGAVLVCTRRQTFDSFFRGGLVCTRRQTFDTYFAEGCFFGICTEGDPLISFFLNAIFLGGGGGILMGRGNFFKILRG